MEQAALIQYTIMNLQPALKAELKALLANYDDELLVVIIGTFNDQNDVVEVDVSSPITLEQYQTGGYIEIYHKVGNAKALL